MSQEVCANFMSDTKRDMSEVFDRVRKLETANAVAKERDKVLIDKMEDLTSFFKAHDEAEMVKYTAIEYNVNKLTNLLYIVTGIGIVLGFIGFENLKLLVG